MESAARPRFYPINHVIVVKDDVVAANQGLSRRSVRCIRSRQA
jgi:hypothetical protein